MKSKFSLAEEKKYFLDVAGKTDQKTLTRWALDCTNRVLPFFENEFPRDLRPKVAIETLEAWIDTGELKMAVIRKASLDSHAAARNVNEDNPARSAARAAGQAVATAHVPTHAIGSAIYALQAIYRKTGSMEEVTRERNWQYQHLLNLNKN